MLSAVNAYQQRLNALQTESDNVASVGGNATNNTETGNFSDMLQEAMSSAKNTLQTSESLQMQAMTGDVDLGELITAVSSAELTVSTIVAMRDRMLSAYQEILRMPI